MSGESNTFDFHRKFVVATNASKQEIRVWSGTDVRSAGEFYSFPTPIQYCKRMEIIHERKRMFEDSLDPSKSDLAEFYENPHFKLVEIDMDSTSN